MWARVWVEPNIYTLEYLGMLPYIWSKPSLAILATSIVGRVPHPQSMESFKTWIWWLDDSCFVVPLFCFPFETGNSSLLKMVCFRTVFLFKANLSTTNIEDDLKKSQAQQHFIATHVFLLAFKTGEIDSQTQPYEVESMWQAPANCTLAAPGGEWWKLELML